MHPHTITKYHGIEFLRFAMALVVILYHLSAWINPLKSSLLAGVITYWQPLAVPVFWCLSGFIFYSVYGNRIQSLHVNFRDFALARFTRLYPLALVTLLVCLALNEIYFRAHQSSFVYHRGDLYHFLLNMLLASHWGLQKVTAFNGPVWSVSVEVITYFIFFIVARFFGKSPVVAILVILLGKAIAHIEPNLTDHLAISSCIQLFFWGGVVSSIYSRLEKLMDSNFTAVLLVLSAFLCFVSLLLPERYSTQLLPPGLVLWSQMAFRNAKGWVTKITDLSGSLTYSSYLLHFPVILLAVMVLDKLQISRSFLVGHSGLVIIMTITLVLSRLTFVYFEVPMQSLLRSRMSRRRSS